jgi:ring-1,2-phenylacetyl-CoA epoxidase subunit PaaE
MHDYQPLRIADVARETAEAIVVTLEVPPALADAFRFRPGQHLPVRARIGGEEQRRTYSICCAPGSGLRIAVKRVAGGAFSNWANDTLEAGASLDVMPPAGRFVLPGSDGRPRHVVAFAAGAGITPILAMIEHGLAAEPKTGFTLVYGNRGPDGIMFRRELEDLKDRHLGRFTLLYVLSRNEESSAPLLEGRITGDKVKAFSASLFKPDEVAHFFLCGPGSMIKEARNALLALGVPRERIHHEFFAPGGGAYRATSPSPSPRVRGEGRGQGQPPSPLPVVEGRGEGKNPEGAEVVAILDGIRLQPRALGDRARLHPHLPGDPEVRAAGARLRRDVIPAAISSSTSRRRSLPKNISSPTKNVGAPKVPRATEASVFLSSLSFTSCSWMRASVRAPSRPAASSDARITSGSSIFFSSSHMRRKTASTYGASRPSVSAATAPRMICTVLTGK